MNEMILIAALLGLAGLMIAYALMPKRTARDEDVQRRMSGRPQAHGGPSAGTGSVRKDPVQKSLWQRAAPLLSKPVMPKSDQEQSTLRVKLASAGFRRDAAPSLFLASKTVMALGLCAIAATVGLSTGEGHVTVLGLAMVAGGIGFMLPNAWLYTATRRRAQAINEGLPDSLDLMVVSVEAGLGLDAAIQRVSDEMRSVHPELAEEMTIATLETQMGIPRTEALQSMAMRTGLPEMRSLVAVVVQAERFGTSIARALRNQADAIRVKRQQRAEERAQKTAVKLMIPLVLFIFPAIMIVLATPAVLSILRQMKSMGM